MKKATARPGDAGYVAVTVYEQPGKSASQIVVNVYGPYPTVGKGRTVCKRAWSNFEEEQLGLIGHKLITRVRPIMTEDMYGELEEQEDGTWKPFEREWQDGDVVRILFDDGSVAAAERDEGTWMLAGNEVERKDGDPQIKDIKLIGSVR